MSATSLRQNRQDELTLPHGLVTRTKSKNLKKTLQGFMKPYVESMQVYFEAQESSVPNSSIGLEDCLFSFITIKID